MKRAYFVFTFLLTLLFASGVMMQTANAKSVHIAGNFAGKYFYDNSSSGRFEGNIQQQGAMIWGECIDQDGSRSTISGTVDGNKIEFIKTYSSDKHQVQYTGKLIPETNTVKGIWRIDRNNSGTFVMTVRGVEASEKVVWMTTDVYYELTSDGTPKNILVIEGYFKNNTDKYINYFYEFNITATIRADIGAGYTGQVHGTFRNFEKMIDPYSKSKHIFRITNAKTIWPVDAYNVIQGVTKWKQSNAAG